MKSFISVVCALFILGCSNDSTPTETTAPIPETTTQAAPAPVEEAAPTEAEAVTAAPTSPTAQPTSVPVPVKVEPAVKAPSPKTPVIASVDGGSLYGQKCASCHGAKGEKAALNKSLIIAEFSEAQIKEALKGYQAGTYGKEMKALMQGQVKALNDAQIDALAKSIAEF